MTDAKSAWHEAGERFSDLGAKLKAHYEQRDQAGDQARAEVRDALHQLTGALDDAFEAIGAAARDDAVKNDVKQVGQSLVTALGATFSEVSTEIQRTFANRPDGTGTGDADRPPSAEPRADGASPTTAAPSAAEPSPSAVEPSTRGATEPDAGSGDAAGSGTSPRVEPWGTP